MAAAIQNSLSESNSVGDTPQTALTDILNEVSPINAATDFLAPLNSPSPDDLEPTRAKSANISLLSLLEELQGGLNTGSSSNDNAGFEIDPCASNADWDQYCKMSRELQNVTKDAKILELLNAVESHAILSSSQISFE